MRKIGLLLLWLIISFGYANAQPLLVDDEYWDKRDIYFNQRLESIIFPPNPRWEKLSDFRKNSKYRSSSSPVGRLKIKKDDGIAICTGFLVGNGLLMTNNHCISDDESAFEARIEMGYYSRTGKLSGYQVITQPILTSRSKDISILSVVGSPEAVWGSVDFSPRDISIGEELFIIHHPGGQPKKLSRVGCFSGPDTKLADGSFVHQCDTIGGSSGSPIFDSTGHVVGIHHSGTSDRGQNAFNQGTKIIAAKEFIDLINSGPGPFSHNRQETPKKDNTKAQLNRNDRSNCNSYGCTTIRDCRREDRNIVCEWDIIASRTLVKNAWARIHQIALDDGRIFALTEMHISNLHSYYFENEMKLGSNSQKPTQIPLGVKFPIRVVFGDVPVDGTPKKLLWQRKNGTYALQMEISDFFP